MLGRAQELMRVTKRRPAVANRLRNSDATRSAPASAAALAGRAWRLASAPRAFTRRTAQWLLEQLAHLVGQLSTSAESRERPGTRYKASWLLSWSALSRSGPRFRSSRPPVASFRETHSRR